MRKLGHKLKKLSGPPARTGGKARKAGDFPSADSGYHNYAETMKEIDKRIEQNPNIMSKQVIGKSYEGRDIIAVKISDNVAKDEDEPEVLFTHHQHAREHLTVEMALYLMREFGAGLRLGRPDKEGRGRPRDLDRPRPQPGRRRVRHRVRLLCELAQEPAAQLRLLKSART